MFIRQFIRLVQRKEELGSVGIPLSTIGHSNQTPTYHQLQSLLIWPLSFPYLPFTLSRSVGCFPLRMAKDDLPVKPQSPMFLIYKWFSIETLAPEPCSCRITRLNNEPRYQSMKNDSIVVSYESVYILVIPAWVFR